jgi:hypothetical protein
MHRWVVDSEQRYGACQRMVSRGGDGMTDEQHQHMRSNGKRAQRSDACRGGRQAVAGCMIRPCAAARTSG